MQLSKAPPLRSRLLFLSFVTCCFLLFPWDSLRPYAFAYAADVDGSGVVSSEYDIGIAGQARAVEVLGDVDDTRLGEELGGEEAVGGNMDERGYRGDFAYFEPALVGRAPEGVDALKEGEKLNKQAKPGSVTYFVLERPKAKRRAKAEGSEQSSGEDTGGLETRQQRNQLYITVNACKLPTPVMLGTNDPPQLKLYVSTSAQNQKPGPKATNDLAGVVTLEGGAANFTVQGADTDVYLGVESPSLAAGWEGDFRFEVAVSSDKPYHSNVDNEPFLYMVDTDSDSALFITHNLTALGSSKDSIEKWLKVPKPEIPFQMYAFPNSAWGAKGLERSVCGIKDAFGTNSSNVRVDASMTDRYGGEGDDKLPKAQFHVQGLQRGTEYNGFLLIDGEAIEGLPLENRLGDLGRGGRVWRKFNWTTKAGKCACYIFIAINFNTLSIQHTDSQTQTTPAK
jgi:calcium channel MID1